MSEPLFPSPLPAQSLFSCPRCGRSGFYARGLLAHVCRGTHILDRRRRLTEAELEQAAVNAVPPPARKEDAP